jgi:hypothetical protein
MSITLWKEYDTSTDEQRDAHEKNFHRRFQKKTSELVNANARVALSDYEV